MSLSLRITARLAGVLASLTLAGTSLAAAPGPSSSATDGDYSPRTRPALFDAMHHVFSAKAAVKPGETAAVLLRVGQVACPGHPDLARLDPSRLRYAALGGVWLQERLTAPSLRSDSAPWHIRAFLSSIEDPERGGFQVDGVNLRAKGIRCSIGASEVAWLDDQVASLPAQHLRQGKSRLEQAGIAELPPRAPTKPVAQRPPTDYKERLRAYFPDYFKGKPARPGQVVYAAQGLERTLHGHDGSALLEHEFLDAMCLFQQGQAFRSFERISRGDVGQVTEFGANYNCDDVAREGRDRAVLALAANYRERKANMTAGLATRGLHNSIMVFGDLNREQAHTMVRWALQSAVATQRAQCPGMAVSVKAVEFWLLSADQARDAAMSVEMVCIKPR